MKICLDAGHGGRDPGACHGNGRAEKNDTLLIAMTLGGIFQANGIEVCYTRTDDRFLSLQGICDFANATGVDLFISCHRDGASNAAAQGAHTCVYEDSGTQHAIGANLAAVFSKYGFPLRANNGISERPELWVLNGTNMNAILLEVGFVTSDNDNQRFDSNFNSLMADVAQAVASTYGITINGGGTPSVPPTPQPSPQPPTSNTDVDVFYQVRTQAHGWLPPVRNYIEHAGWQDSPITDVAIRVSKGTISYSVHVLGGGWLPPVTGFNINDHNNGYAGIGVPIDAIRVYYNTPGDIRPFKEAIYKVAPVGGNYFSEQHDTIIDQASGQDGYAGAFGSPIGKLLLKIA